jgi:hypothetical protein
MGIIVHPNGKVARGAMTEIGHNTMIDRAVALPAGDRHHAQWQQALSAARSENG